MFVEEHCFSEILELVSEIRRVSLGARTPAKCESPDGSGYFLVPAWIDFNAPYSPSPQVSRA
ncbi:hypothetical protein FQN53_009325 [Emmonsiellopsis sp. PD_33]|nr:hypothetical protein FQN53_009325 [Emmonsiellopsis sp. PD_33]